MLSDVDAAVPGEKLTAAFQGCKSAVIVTPHFDFAKDAELTVNMIDACEAAGVAHVVFVGSWTVVAPDCIIAKRFVPAEARLKQSSLKWTSLRSGYFMGNYAGLFRQAKVFFPDLTIPPVDPKDIGRVAAAICLDPEWQKHHGMCYNISGPEQLTTTQIVDKVRARTGREVEYVAVPVANLAPPNPPIFLIELLKHIDAHGLACDPVTKHIAGVHTSFDDYLAEHLADFAEAPQ